jgi:hypothetical protein
MNIHAPVAPDAIGPRTVTLPEPMSLVTNTDSETPG